MEKPITIKVEPSDQEFGDRAQWRWGIVAGNGEPIDPRDTMANPGDIEAIMRKLVASDTPVVLEVHHRTGYVERKQLR